MNKPEPLPIWDRELGKLTYEFMDDSPQTYETNPNSLSHWLKSWPLYDSLAALYEESPFSKKNIKPFIRKHNINMSEFEPNEYKSYGEFFVCEFRPDMRSFPSNPKEMGAIAEARYFGWEKFDDNQNFPIKGRSLNAEQILGSKDLAKQFNNGPIMVIRLAPMDYHHVHYPDNGYTIKRKKLGNRLWTVNWKALQNKENILIQNERETQLLETKNFGCLGIVEVGTLTVGRIVHKHPTDKPFKRAQQKSMFRFGGSAIVLFGEAGKWLPCEDILKYTKEGVETYIKLGKPIAKSLL